VTVDLDASYGRLLNQTRTLLVDNLQKGLSGEELAAAMEAGLTDLGDTLINQMGRGGQPPKLSTSAETWRLKRFRSTSRSAFERKYSTSHLPSVREAGWVRWSSSIRTTTSTTCRPTTVMGESFCRGFYLFRT